jgi:putative restriction endonuclease
MAAGKKWTREELLVLLNVYQKLQFGQFDQSQPVVQDIAARMGRTPGSVAMKLCNLASLDEALTKTGRKGLTGASELDRQIWHEFQADRGILIPKSEEAFRHLFGAGEADEVELVKGAGVQVRKAISPPDGPTEVPAQINARRGQQFFRQMILNAFEGRCCVTGIGVRKLLVASHILPWKPFENERLDPQNGLCLSRLHDGAFDQGLITFDEDYRLVLSKELKAHLPQTALEFNFVAFAGKPLVPPQNGRPPSQTFLDYHRRRIFQG